MPRPALKRRRTNSFTHKNKYTRTIERIKVPSPAEAHQHLAKKLAGKAIGSKPEDSDDSDRVVVTNSSARNRQRGEIYASGGVAKGDTPNVTPRKSKRSQRLREDTEEILSERSRTSSRANSDVEGASTKPSKKATTKASAREKEKPVKAKAVQSESKITRHEPQQTSPAVTTNPATSVLGTFKPRKRQASILQLIDQNESTIIDSDDERQFLPDEVSTPAGNKIAQPQPQPTPVSTSKTYSSLKRKRDSLTANVFSLQNDVSPVNGIESVGNIVEPTRTQKRKLSTNQKKKQSEDDSIMAPPQSSDEEDDAPAMSKSSSSARKSKPVAPTTKQLQSLMPSKQRNSKRKIQNVFDLPEHSQQTSDEPSDSEDEHSMFQSSKRRRPAKAKATDKHVGYTKAKTKNKTNRTSTPSPTKLRTPIPISASRTSAKSPLKQARTPLRDKSNTQIQLQTSALKPTTSTRKRYGGSRDQHRETGKENGSVDIEAESSNGKSVDEVVKTEGQKWKEKWADIDDFEMEFEEVSMSTRSNSPMAR